MSVTSPFPGRRFGAFLFDMDGTIINSIAAAERVWSVWAKSHGLDVAKFLPTIHGVRAIETVRNLELVGVDVEREVATLLEAEMSDMEGIMQIAGAADFLASLPTDRWAIVTSAPRELAKRRLAATGLPVPPVFVTNEDVTNGKPAPDCFLLGAQKLGVPPSECLVFEDAIAGIRGAEAAGMGVLVIRATHSHTLEVEHPSVSGYDDLLAFRLPDGGLEIRVRD